ncbi:biopolymer transporter TonB [Agaricicola taiwanensis]|uniref:Biopolymer transporter TonB n=1 Tax=Agaricicola taiwanensis TaxID=591372 RepID=A0A8J2YLZ5_9RHOB|nr:energy transducer TonB [Agaricicola taiwanensis]GGE52016.1 biopolymer transporter TonB [Agaricicola taiwanensis]
MSAAAGRIHAGRGLAADTALWTGAGIVALAAHLGAAAWLLSEPPVIAADAAPPAAIMIDLAELPEAVRTEMNEISPDQETSELVTPAEEQQAPEEVPPQEMAEPEPEPVEPEPVAEPAETDMEDVVEAEPQTAVPLPLARPRPPEPPKEVAKRPDRPKPPVKQRQQSQAPTPQRVEAQAQVTESARNAARQNASGVSSASPARWQSRLMAHLERRKRYPPGAKSRGETGIVYVRFSLDETGNVLSVSLARSSGFPELDSEVLSLVRRASPVPAPPPGAQRTITAPVRFNTR